MPHELLSSLAGRRGHFQMESGYHSDTWFELDPLFAAPARLRPFVSELAGRLAARRIDGVCGPMTGGAKLAELIASEMSLPSFYAERCEISATGLFPVQYRLPAAQRERVRGMRLAIIDDAISAGSAARGTFADLAACGAQPVALGALIVFGHAIDEFARSHQLTVDAVERTSLNLWAPADCPLCRSGGRAEIVSDRAQQ